MASLLDASVWIDFSRARSPDQLKKLITPYVLRPDACVSEPVMFEVLRHATDDEAEQLQAQFSTMVTLPTPPTLWRDAAVLGQSCRRRGFTAGSLDLLVASTAIYHDAELVTFDTDFERIAEVTNLRVKRLQWPVV
jgi:predicted nucleic acid-binding protein